MRIRRKTKRRIKRLIYLSPLFAAIWFGYMVVRPPASALPSRVPVARTEETIERGRHLFTVLAACDRCHSGLDFTRLNNPVIPNLRAAGRQLDLRGLPGSVTAPNLTPDRETGLGSWTDGEKIRAIRDGISKDGRALYPLMPYPYYRKMSDEDVQAIVAYLDSLAPVRSALPPTSVSFLTRVFMKSDPQPAGAIPAVDPGGGVIYGEYLVTIAACESCHTPSTRFANRRLSGGVFFETPYGQVYSSNITPHPLAGIGRWNFQRFQARMRHHREFEKEGPPRVSGDRFTVMPWEGYAQLTGEELEAMFNFLRSMPPVDNFVEPHPGSQKK